MYKGVGVWEKFHCSLFMRLLKKKSNNILATLDKSKVSTFKNLVISSILATDMAEHEGFVKKLQIRNIAT